MGSSLDDGATLGLARARHLGGGPKREYHPYRCPRESASRDRQQMATALCPRGLGGLHDAPRPGPRRRYDEATEQRVLKQLDQPPPPGYARWNGRLLAQALGDVSPRQVWRILSGREISLARRRRWCISTDPEFARKAADIVGIYLHPPGECRDPLRGRKASYSSFRTSARILATAQRQDLERLQS